MPTITNRSPLSKGYSRDRKNLSRPIRCIYLGLLTQEEFKQIVEGSALPKTSIRSIEFHTNKATIHFKDSTRKRYSYQPVTSPQIPTTLPTGSNIRLGEKQLIISRK